MAFSLRTALIRRSLVDFGTIPTFARDYLRVLRAEYDGIPKPAEYTDPPDVEAFKEKTDDRVWSWADLVTIENAILNVTPDADVRAMDVRWRERYRDIVGDVRYAFYTQSSPPDPKSASPSDLRADVRALANRIHYLLATITAREKMRNRLALFLGAVMIAAALVVLGNAINWNNGIPSIDPKCLKDNACLPLTPLQLVTVAGLFGGFVSVQQRLQSATDVDPFFKRLELSSGWGSVVLIAPLMGMVFAIVLFEIFVSGAVSGFLVPAFADVSKNSDLSSFQTFVAGSTPKSPADWAKLCVWSFIAGFAERFVPDVLTRLADMKNLFSATKS